MTLESIAIFGLIFLGSLLQGAIGFGFGILVLPFLFLLLPYMTAVVTVNILATFLAGFMAYKNRQYIHRDHILIPLIFAFVTSVIGIQLLDIIEPILLKILLGILLILSSLWYMFFNKRVRIKPTNINGAVAGSLAGLSGGMFSIGGPPIALYFFSVFTDKHIYHATVSFFFVLRGAFGLATHAFKGNITSEVLKISAISVLAVLAGSYLGMKVLKSINTKVLGWIIYVFIFSIGVFFVLDP